MPAYVAGRAPDLRPGDMGYSIFDGTETPSAGLSSLAFARGQSPSGADQGTTFSISFPSASPNATVLIQGSNQDVDAQYQTLWTSTGLQYDNFTDDVGRWAFYRSQLSAYSSGGMPAVIAKR